MGIVLPLSHVTRGVGFTLKGTAVLSLESRTMAQNPVLTRDVRQRGFPTRMPSSVG